MVCVNGFETGRICLELATTCGTLERGPSVWRIMRLRIVVGTGSSRKPEKQNVLFTSFFPKNRQQPPLPFAATTLAMEFGPPQP